MYIPCASLEESLGQSRRDVKSLVEEMHTMKMADVFLRNSEKAYMKLATCYEYLEKLLF